MTTMMDRSVALVILVALKSDGIVGNSHPLLVVLDCLWNVEEEKPDLCPSGCRCPSEDRELGTRKVGEVCN